MASLREMAKNSPFHSGETSRKISAASGESSNRKLSLAE